MRLVSRQHGFLPHKKIDHISQVKQSTLFSLCGLIPIIFLLFIMLSACGGASSTPSGPTVSAIDNAFSPTELHIKVGQTVTWVNNGQTSHTVTADDNSYDSGLFDPGAQYWHKFTKPGRYLYYCTLHGGPGGSGMAGVIIVDSSSSSLVSADYIVQPSTPPHAILRVPEQYSTIQAAVNAAVPGDLVSVGPSNNPDGTYHESVRVKTSNITIRGRNRNKVILRWAIQSRRWI